MKKHPLLAVIFGGLLISVGHASSLTYNGGVSGSWTNGGGGWLDGVTGATWNNATPDAATFAGVTPTSVTVDGGVTVGNVSVTAGTYDIGGTGTLTLSSTTWDVASGLTNTVSTALAGATGLIKSGAGILSLTGTNKAFTGAVTINGGAIQITNALAGNLGSANSTAITLNGGALYGNFAADTTVNYAIAVTNSGELRNLGGAKFTVAANKISGSGTLTLSFGTNNARFVLGNGTSGSAQSSFTGKWVVDSGGNVNRFLDLYGGANLGNVTGDDAVTLQNTGTLLLRSATYSTNSSGGSFGITIGSGGGRINVGGNSTVILANKLSGAVGNALAFGLDANSVLVLSNTANSYVGDTSIIQAAGTNGIVRLGLAGVLPDSGGTVSVGSGATLDLNGFSETIGALAGAGFVDNRAASTASVLTAGGNNQSTTFSGVLSNSGSGATLALVKAGTGNLTLNTSNSFSGGTTVQAGRLVIANSNALGGGNVLLQSIATGTSNRAYLTLSNLTVTGKMLTMDSTTNRAILISTGTGASTWDGTITLAGGASALENVELTSEGGSFLTVSGTVNGSISNAARNLTLRGSGTTNMLSATVNIGSTELAKTDAGNTWRISSTGNTWGATTISSGKLLVGSSDALPDSTAVSVSNGATLDVNGFSETVGSIAGAGKIDNSGAVSTLTVGGNNSSTTFSGVLTNSGSALSLTKAGNGTLTLSGANSYGGTTTVSAGALIINGNNSAAGGLLTVAAGAKLGGSGTVGGATTISGTLSPGNSPGTQTFANGLTQNNGSSLLWELNVNAIGTRGTSYDGVNVTGGNLDFAGATTMTLNLAGGAVDWSNAFWGSNYLGAAGWLVYDVTGGGSISGFENLSLANIDWTDSLSQSLSSIRPGASFALYQDSNSIYLNYNAVPEPSTYALLGMGAVACWGYVLRRRRR